jgi:hypothetical protein
MSSIEPNSSCPSHTRKQLKFGPRIVKSKSDDEASDAFLPVVLFEGGCVDGIDPINPYSNFPLIFPGNSPNIFPPMEGSAMIPSVPFRKHLLPLAAIGALTTTAFSQSPPKYDPATETTLKGTVEELKLVPPSGAKPLAYLLTQTGPDKDKDTVRVFLCPKSFLDQMGIAFKTDESIQITGSKVKQAGADLILAREVVKSGETVTFRFQDGKPAW